MTKKTIPISLRISEEDAEFINSLRIEGAQSPSEKVRALIQDARHRQEYGSLYSLAQEMFNDEKESIRVHEFREGTHSELLSLYVNWLIESFAHFGAYASKLQSEENGKTFNTLEKEVTDRIYRLIDSTLRMTVTERAPCYNADLLREKYKEIQELTKVISSQIK